MAEDYSKLTPEQIKQKFYEEYPEERPEVKQAMQNLAMGVPVDPNADYSKLSPSQIKEKMYEEYPETLPGAATTQSANDSSKPMGFWGHLFHKDALPFVAGALQGAANIAPSAVNGVLSPINYLTGTHLAIPYVNLLEDVDQSPESQTLGDVGALAGSIAGGAGGYKALSALAEPATLAGDAALGALSGYLSGGSDNQEDVAGRVAGAALGGAAPVLVSSTAKSLANRLVARKNELEDIYRNAYGNLFKKIDSSGLGEKSIYPKGVRFKIKESYKKELAEDLSPKDRKRLNKFYRNPTVENAHYAQSALGKKANILENRMTSSSVINPDDKDMYFALLKARNQIKDKMASFLKSNKKPEILEEYGNLGDSYKRNFVPFSSRDIRKFEEGKINSNTLIKNILSNPKLFESENPIANLKGLQSKENIRKIIPYLKKAGSAAALGAALSGGFSLGIPGTDKLKQAFDKVV